MVEHIAKVSATLKENTQARPGKSHCSHQQSNIIMMPSTYDVNQLEIKDTLIGWEHNDTLVY